MAVSEGAVQAWLRKRVKKQAGDFNPDVALVALPRIGWRCEEVILVTELSGEKLAEITRERAEKRRKQRLDAGLPGADYPNVRAHSAGGKAVVLVASRGEPAVPANFYKQNGIVTESEYNVPESAAVGTIFGSGRREPRNGVALPVYPDEWIVGFMAARLVTLGWRVTDPFESAFDVAGDYDARHDRPTREARGAAFWRWAYAHGLSEAAAEAVEFAERRVYPVGGSVGTCQACFRAIRVEDHVIYRHGWNVIGERRVGDYGNTCHTGACVGTGYVQFEQDCALTAQLSYDDLPSEERRLKLELRRKELEPKEQRQLKAELSGVTAMIDMMLERLAGRDAWIASGGARRPR